MLLIDQFQRFVPGRWFIDRGQRLEQAWERAWGDEVDPTGGGGNPFARPFVELYAQVEDGPGARRHDVPLLFLNATVVQDGRRFIQHPLTIAAADFERAFPAAVDATAHLRATTPLSTVAHNSARFTYVSPAGTIPGTDDGRDAGLQVVDGGYFENSGTATLRDIYRMLLAAGIDPEAIRIVHLSNDAGVEPLLGPDRCPDRPGERPDQRRGQVAYGEISAPLFALLNTRGARGLGAREELRDRVTPPAQDLPIPPDRLDAGTMTSLARLSFHHFRVCDLDRHLPLGWTLSEGATQEMERQLGVDDASATDPGFIAFHRAQIETIVAELRAAMP
jgi:hypothetical protein